MSTRPERYRSTRVLKRVLARAAPVTEQEIAEYEERADGVDAALLQAVLDGYVTPAQVSAYLQEREDTGLPQLKPGEVAKRLQDPQRVAWLNARLLQAFPNLAGILWANLYYRALGGDTKAASLFIQRFDPAYRPTTRRESASVTADLTPRTDAQVSAKLLEKLRALVPGGGGGAE